MEALVAEAEDEPSSGRRSPPDVDLASADALADDLEATIDVLVARLRSVDPAAVADRIAATLATATKPSPIAPLEQAAAAETLVPEHACPPQAGAPRPPRGNGRRGLPPTVRRHDRRGRRADGRPRGSARR